MARVSRPSRPGEGAAWRGGVITPLLVGALAANITCDAPLFLDIAPPSPLSRVGLPTLIVRRTTAHLIAKL